MQATQAMTELIQALNRKLSDELQLLLETKHLYQRVTIEAEQIAAALQARLLQNELERSHFQIARDRILHQEDLTILEDDLRMVERGGQTPAVMLGLHLRNVKLFCLKCDGREVFRPISYTEAVEHLRNPALVHDVPMASLYALKGAFQIFFLVYQCQRCHGAPTSFLVRRERWHLVLDGRSPMEHVEVPNFIPKPERPLFRDAVIAIQAGKTLAALFYLRD